MHYPGKLILHTCKHAWLARHKPTYVQCPSIDMDLHATAGLQAMDHRAMNRPAKVSRTLANSGRSSLESSMMMPHFQCQVFLARGLWAMSQGGRSQRGWETVAKVEASALLWLEECFSLQESPGIDHPTHHRKAVLEVEKRSEGVRMAAAMMDRGVDQPALPSLLECEWSLITAMGVVVEGMEPMGAERVLVFHWVGCWTLAVAVKRTAEDQVAEVVEVAELRVVQQVPLGLAALAWALQPQLQRPRRSAQPLRHFCLW
mmetsp:Transcript_14922/g.32925  ORF Transcript_14922/g.32925 Transcript_14922/m.32925 type:complete len:259 (+) Transcript_14922:51-827(+)